MEYKKHDERNTNKRTNENETTNEAIANSMQAGERAVEEAMSVNRTQTTTTTYYNIYSCWQYMGESSQLFFCYPLKKFISTSLAPTQR